MMVTAKPSNPVHPSRHKLGSVADSRYPERNNDGRNGANSQNKKSHYRTTVPLRMVLLSYRSAWLQKGRTQRLCQGLAVLEDV
jgi:hypothetical protein